MELIYSFLSYSHNRVTSTRSSNTYEKILICCFQLSFCPLQGAAQTCLYIYIIFNACFACIYFNFELFVPSQTKENQLDFDIRRLNQNNFECFVGLIVNAKVSQNKQFLYIISWVQYMCRIFLHTYRYMHFLRENDGTWNLISFHKLFIYFI